MASLTPRLDGLDFNLLINGSMDYWQRGTSFTASSNVYGADRWKHNIIASHYQVLRSTNIPVVDNINYSYQADCLAVAAPAAADQEMIEQFVEQNVARRVLGKKARVVFWVSSPKTGQHNIYVVNTNASTWSILVPYTVSVANTWQKVTLDIDFSSMPNTIPYGTGTGFVIGFPLGIGSNRTNAVSNTWQNADYKLLTGSPNLLDNTANNFYVTGVMMIPYQTTLTNPPNPDGYVYAGKDILSELELCQRYFEKSYDLTVAPASVTDTGIHNTQIGTTQTIAAIYFATRKRTSSLNMTYYSRSGASGVWRNYTAGTDVVVTSQVAGEKSWGVVLSGFPSGNNIGGHWTAEAEL